MPILIYHSTDEVNLDTLRKLADVRGLDVQPQWPRDGLALDGHAVLLDADSWWTDAVSRARGLEELLALAGRRPLAVHGWQLIDEQLERLDDHGILAGNRLDDDLIVGLVAEAARRKLPAGQTGGVR